MDMRIIRLRDMRGPVLLGVFVQIGLFWVGPWSAAAEEMAAAPVNVPNITVSGTVIQANELGEAYYVMLERSGVPAGESNKSVLSLTPESEITIGGVKRTPDDFLRLVRMGKDEATAVYFSNSEGMKHVIAITVEPKR